MTTAPPTPATTLADPAVARLTAVLSEALLALGATGDPDQANRLAGRAWSATRVDHPLQARRINAVMHRLSRLPQTTKGS